MMAQMPRNTPCFQKWVWLLLYNYFEEFGMKIIHIICICRCNIQLQGYHSTDSTKFANISPTFPSISRCNIHQPFAKINHYQVAPDSASEVTTLRRYTNLFIIIISTTFKSLVSTVYNMKTLLCITSHFVLLIQCFCPIMWFNKNAIS